KQYISPSPPVPRRSLWLQPPSGPREGCDEFHERDAASSRKPLRSMWPTIAVPCVLLVQLRQVRSSPGGKARPSGVEPVNTSCRFGAKPTPGMIWPRSDSEVLTPSLLLSLCRSSTLVATTSPLKFFHGPLPTRSRAFTAGLPSAPCVLR